MGGITVNGVTSAVVRAVGDVGDGDRVVVGIRDVEQLMHIVHFERIGGRAFRSKRRQRGRQTFHALKRPRIDPMDRVVVGAGDIEILLTSLACALSPEYRCRMRGPLRGCGESRHYVDQSERK